MERKIIKTGVASGHCDLMGLLMCTLSGAVDIFNISATVVYIVADFVAVAESEWTAGNDSLTLALTAAPIVSSLHT